MSEPKPAADVAYSPEQGVFLSKKDSGGSFIAIANAGSGKTECGAELACRCYERIEQDLFPVRRGHVGGDDQLKILQQILVVTFTKKAAAEMDQRIKKKFAARGIPMPMRFGKDFIICRTLDSFLQLWVSKPAFFESWIKHDPDWEQCLTRIYRSISPAARTVLAANEKGKGSPLYGLFLKWDRLLIGDRQEALVDLVVRMEFERPPLEGFGLDEIMAKFEMFKAGLDPERNTWAANYLEAMAQAYRRHENEMKGLLDRRRAKIGHGHAVVTPLTVADEESLDAWRAHAQRRGEFLQIYELARSRGYDPVTEPKYLGTYDIIKATCSSKSFEHLRPIHSMATAYRRIKRALGCMDFGDYLHTFIAVTKSKFGRWLLEQDKKYPAMGFRRSVVIWDEVQDNNPSQFAVLRSFVTRPPFESTAPAKPYLSVAIGDPFQSLYEFRGANPYQFISAIERARKAENGSLLGLTISFRSAKAIVRLGNAIVSSMSSFAENANPSKTIYTEEGRIVLSKPIHTLDEEADWVLNHMAEIRKGEGGTFMVVVRSGLEHHPLYRRLSPAMPKDVTFMTIHACKGLEADHVFVLSLTSGKFPDVRGSMDQEVNAFYVACTRPRRTLFLSAPMVTTVEKEEGSSEDVLVGPSIFILKVPELKKLALASGWTDANLRMGLDTHNSGLAAFLRDLDKKRPQLQAEAKMHFGEDGEPPAIRSAKYLGAMANLPEMPPERALPPPAEASDFDDSGNNITVTAEIAAVVLAKLKKGFFKNGRPPIMSGKEKSISIQSGWVAEVSGRIEWTPGFKGSLRKPAA